MARKIGYSEPTEYIPKSIRKQLGLGEYAEKPAKKTDKPKTTKKDKSKSKK